MRITRGQNAYHVKAAIQAGGFGKRLNSADPLKCEYPIAKPSCVAGNLRFIEFSLRALAKAGITEWHIATFHLPETIQRVIKSGKIYDPNVSIQYVQDSPSEALDTAGSIAKIVRENGWHEDPRNIVVVSSADIIHNVPIGKILMEHIKNHEEHGAVATIVVNRVSWERVSDFGTVRLEGMPERKDFAGDQEFEDAVSAWIINNQAASRMIMEFREKKPFKRNEKPFDDIFEKTRNGLSHWIDDSEISGRLIQQLQDILSVAKENISSAKILQEVCLSSLNNMSLYFLNADVFAKLFPLFTKKIDKTTNPLVPLFPELYNNPNPFPFSDFGGHIYPWLIRNGYPVYAYILPDRYEDGTPSYWRDAGKGEEWLQANKDVLNGKIDTGLNDSSHWTPEPWGWRGKNVYIHPSAKINTTYKSIIGDDVIIEQGVTIVHSVIGSGTIVKAGSEIHGSVIQPKSPDQEELNTIEEDARIIDSIILGGRVRTGAELRNRIYYDPKYGVAAASLKGETPFPE